MTRLALPCRRRPVPTALMLALGASLLQPALAGSDATALSTDQQLRAVSAQLQDLGALMRPLSRRDNLPANLVLASLAPTSAQTVALPAALTAAYSALDPVASC